MAAKRGLGSIRKLPSGRYQVRYTDPNGVRRTARTTFKAKSQAEFELTNIRNAVESGTWHVDETPQAGPHPKFSSCAEAARNGYKGPYVRGVNPEYAWYQDRDRDGVVCE